MKKMNILLSTLIIICTNWQVKAQITEDFETTSPTGWSFYSPSSGDPGFIRTSTQQHGASYSFYHNDDNIASVSTSWMVSPSHACGSTDELRFWYYQNYTASYYNYSGVWVSSSSGDPISNPGDFTEIQELNASAPGGFSEDIWTEFVTNMSAYDGQTIYIAFKYTGDYEHELYIDDFSLIPTAPCTDPSVLSATNITGNTADLGWTENGPATQWDIELGLAGFIPTGTPTADNVNSNPYTYSGLLSLTGYDFYVRADCGGGNTSAWIGPFNFTTPTAPCNDPSALTTTSITSSYADLGWTENGVASQWDIELGTIGFIPTGTPTANNVNTNPYTYSGLSSSTSYDYYVRADCGGDSSAWIGPHNFSTLAPNPLGTDCSDPYVIAALPYIETGMTTSGFGDDYSSSDGCGSFTSRLNGDDFVIEYTPPSDECIKITLTSTPTGSVGIFAYNFCPLSPSSCMGNVGHDSNPYFPNLPLSGGVTYYFIISSDGTPQSMNFDLRMESVPCIDESNDECVNAITLIQDTVCDPTLGSFWTATDDGIDGSCEFSNKDDVWYSFVATTTNPIIYVERFGSISIHLYDQPSPCPPIASSDIDCGQGINQLNTSGLTIGNTYYIEVSNYASHFDYTFNICVYDFPPQPPCNANPVANDDCDFATVIANLDGYCGNTSGTYTPGDIPDSFCGSIENNSWLSFVAGETEASLSIFTYDCAVGEGIQMQIYETFDCANFTPVSNCWNPGSESNGVIIANNLTLGATYYLMIDGFNGDNCTYTISGMTGIALPIELVDLSAKYLNNKAEIQWITKSETNNDYFEIQRSYDGSTFETIGFVSGSGNSNDYISYDIIDETPYLGTSYYRIKQVDFDGQFSYSKMTVLYCNNINNNLNINAIYNPYSSQIDLSCDDKSIGGKQFEIRNSTGQLIYTGYVNERENNISIPFSQYSDGLYILSVQLQKGYYNQKIIKQ